MLALVIGQVSWHVVKKSVKTIVLPFRSPKVNDRPVWSVNGMLCAVELNGWSNRVPPANVEVEAPVIAAAVELP